MRATLAARLGDAASVHWVIAELDGVLNDALKTWNCAAHYYRVRGAFPTIASEPFYDLTAVLSDSSSLVLEKTATVQDVCATLEFRLMEPQTVDYTLPWTGTEQFSFEMIRDAIQKRRDRFLSFTGMQVAHLPLINAIVGNGRISIGELASTNVRRVAWKSLDGTFSNLWRVDEEMLNRRLVNWNIDSGTPESFSIVTTPEASIQLAPVPIDNGLLDVLVIQTGAVVDLAANSLVGIFEDFVPYIIWGALAELLGRDGPAQDTARAQYCEQRWSEGLQLADLFLTTIQVLVNDQAVPVQSLERLDFGVPAWQYTTGTPETAAQVSPNLIALYKVPDGIYGVSVDVVRNALLLATDNDHIQLADEVIGPYLDYCVHVALFKDGGAEFAATLPYLQRFYEVAGQYNSALKAFASTIDVLSQQSQLESQERPLAA